MNILLTGSGGFVGKNLKRYFQESHNLFTPRSYDLDLTDSIAIASYFEQNNIDCIVHCAVAGSFQKNIETTVEDNVKMVENLLKYKKPDARVILFGSGAMYDKNRELHKVKEEEIGDYIPENLYGKAKLEISKFIKNRKDVVCLNIFGCYGYEERETRFPTYAIRQVLSNQPIEINQNVVFDYLFIDDLCKIVEFFINNQPAENIINVTPTESISLTQIAEIVNTFGSTPVQVNILKHGMNFEYTGDNKRLLKFIPKFKFTEYPKGLESLYKYVLSSLVGGGNPYKYLTLGLNAKLKICNKYFQFGVFVCNQAGGLV